jgi:hypothetical protein
MSASTHQPADQVSEPDGLGDARVVVIGAGQEGLAVSHELSAALAGVCERTVTTGLVMTSLALIRVLRTRRCPGQLATVDARGSPARGQKNRMSVNVAVKNGPFAQSVPSQSHPALTARATVTAAMCCSPSNRTPNVCWA